MIHICDIRTDQVCIVGKPAGNDLDRQDRSEASRHRILFNFFELFPDLFRQDRLAADTSADSDFFQIKQPVKIVDLDRDIPA